MNNYLVKIFIGGLLRLYTPDGERLSHVVCHGEMKIPLQKALACVVKTQKDFNLTYHGCYNNRNIRGKNKLSQHAFGRAIDINANSEMPPEVAHCFEQAGFRWGGRWRGKDYDPMHFQID